MSGIRGNPYYQAQERHVMSQTKLTTFHMHTHTQIASCNLFTWWVNYLCKYWICLSDYFARGANTCSHRTTYAARLSFSLIFSSNWCLQVCGCEFLSQSVSSSHESTLRETEPPFFPSRDQSWSSQWACPLMSLRQGPSLPLWAGC